VEKCGILFANKRHAEIVKAVKENNGVKVIVLAEKFNVSIETVRRDLLELEKKNLLVRVHGGAMPVEEMMTYHDLSMRKEENVEEKRELAVTGARFVEDNDIIYVDSGSTPVHFANAIKNKKITVVTCSLDVFNELNGGIAKVILVGGEYCPAVASFCGGLAVETLQKLFVNKAFIFPSAISLRHGVCDFSQEIYPMQKEVLKRADKIFILATSNKFEKNGLLKICDVLPEYTFITDKKLTLDQETVYLENGIKIIK
jgi:DeoR/GlpR family transcriptional regulator of sugar metabolism